MKLKQMLRILTSGVILLLSCLYSPNPATAADTTSIVAEYKSAGDGGIEDRVNCLNGYVVQGISAEVVKWQGKDVLSQISNLCKEVQEDGRGFANELITTTPRGILDKGVFSKVQCPDPLALKGVTVYESSENGYVVGIEILCSEILGDKPSKIREMLGTNAGTRKDLMCPDSSIVVGSWLRYGEILDSFGIRCARIRGISQAEIKDVTLSITQKAYPYSQEVNVLSIKGGSGAGLVQIDSARNGEGGIGCSYESGVLKAQSAGTCRLVVTKLGDETYAPSSVLVDFKFFKAKQKLEVKSTTSQIQNLSSTLQSLELQVLKYQGEGELTFDVIDGTASGCELTDKDLSSTLSARTPGTCLLSARIDEDDNYEFAQSARIPITLLAANKEIPAPRPLPVEKKGLKIYNPLSEPEKLLDTQIAAFALLSALAAGAASSASSSGSSRDSGQARSKEGDENENAPENEDKDREAGDVASADLTKLAFRRGMLGKGDSSRIWQVAYQPKIELNFRKLIENTALFSPLLSRIAMDGTYLRAMFSTFSLLPMICASMLALFIARDAEFVAVPTSITLMAAALLLSVLDAFAGFVLGTTLFVVALLQGEVGNLDQFMVAVGMFALMVTPALIASSIRPLRRVINNRGDIWERLTDYALATLIGGWTVEKIVGSLNGLAGFELQITQDARVLGIATSVFIFIRMILEDVATYLFPQRLGEQDSNPKDTYKIQAWASLFIKTAIFFLVSSQFLGLSKQLYLGTAIFILPQLIKLLTDELQVPKSKLIYHIIPRGTSKIVIMVLIGTFFANLVRKLYDNPGEYLTWSFVLLAIPGTIFALLKIVAAPLSLDWTQSEFKRIVYKLGGLIIGGLILAMYLGVDIYAWIF
jgi:hypothetical protein